MVEPHWFIEWENHVEFQEPKEKGMVKPKDVEPLVGPLTLLVIRLMSEGHDKKTAIDMVMTRFYDLQSKGMHDESDDTTDPVGDDDQPES